MRPSSADFYTEQDARNVRGFQRWMLAAAIAYLAATAAVRWRESLGATSAWLPWLLVGTTVCLALAAVRHYLSFLRQAEELLRRIQLEALGLGFAAGVVVAFLYPMFEGLGAPPIGGRALAVVMLLAWAGGSWLAARKFSGGE